MLRRSPRALALWATAAVVAVVTATVVAGDLAALHRRAAGLGPERAAVVATRDLAVGHTVGVDDLALRRVHASQLPPGVLDTTTSAVGRVVTVPVLRGGYLAPRNLTTRHRSGLAGVVPSGMRAIRVVVTDAIRPHAGASVDVLATADAGATDATDRGGARLVADGVLVLGTDTRTTTGGGRAGAFGVTVLVDPEQARDLAAAQAEGVVTLALLPPEAARR